jgi:hypothetical protein
MSSLPYFPFLWGREVPELELIREASQRRQQFWTLEEE